MNCHATGRFEVEVEPQSASGGEGGAALGRTSLEKTFTGDLVVADSGEMLKAVAATEGSVGHVTVERVTGTLHGRGGSFVLQHIGTMNRGARQSSVTVVPDCWTGQLAGIVGTFTQDIADGKHFYESDCGQPDRRSQRSGIAAEPRADAPSGAG